MKDGSRESFSAISSGRYFSSMAAARNGSGAGAPAGPTGKGAAATRVRVPGGGKSPEAALPPGRLPPGAAGTHPEGSAANPRPGAGRDAARAGATPPAAHRTRDAEKSLCGDARGDGGRRRGGAAAAPREPLTQAGRDAPPPRTRVERTAGAAAATRAPPAALRRLSGPAPPRRLKYPRQAPPTGPRPGPAQ